MKAMFFFFGMLMILILTVCFWWPELTSPSPCRKIEAHEKRINQLEQKYSHIKLAVLEAM